MAQYPYGPKPSPIEGEGSGPGVEAGKAGGLSGGFPGGFGEFTSQSANLEERSQKQCMPRWVFRLFEATEGTKCRWFPTGERDQDWEGERKSMILSRASDRSSLSDSHAASYATSLSTASENSDSSLKARWEIRRPTHLSSRNTLVHL